MAGGRPLATKIEGWQAKDDECMERLKSLTRQKTPFLRRVKKSRQGVQKRGDVIMKAMIFFVFICPLIVSYACINGPRIQTVYSVCPLATHGVHQTRLSLFHHLTDLPPHSPQQRYGLSFTSWQDPVATHIPPPLAPCGRPQPPTIPTAKKCRDPFPRGSDANPLPSKGPQTGFSPAAN